MTPLKSSSLVHVATKCAMHNPVLLYWPAERGSWPQWRPAAQGGAALAGTVVSLSRARDDRLW